MDVNDFRRFNEVRGYTASDGALKALVTVLKNLLRPTDFLGRWGGDEFVILTPQQESAACQLADVVQEMARNGPFDRENSISLSVGVARFSKEMDAPVLAIRGEDDFLLSLPDLAALKKHLPEAHLLIEIGRASCRERV